MKKYSSWTIDSCRPANPVNVVIWVFWGVGLKDKVNILEVNTPWNHISCEKNSIFLAKELFDDSFSSSRFQFSVNSIYILIFFPFEISSQQFRIVIYTSASTQKDDGLGVGHSLLKEIYQKMHLLPAVFHHNISVV